MQRHIQIENVSPSVDAGRYRAKRVVGERCVVEADVFRDGHETIRAELLWWTPDAERPARYQLRPLVNDRWRAEVGLEQIGRHRYSIEAWTDVYASWLEDLRKRVEGGQPKLDSELLEGARLLERLAERAGGAAARELGVVSKALLAAAGQPPEALARASDERLLELVARHQPRADLVTLESPLELTVDRVRACFGAWYEMFPRSQGREPGRAASLREAEWRLRDVAAMGFDVLYLPPIHPIGHTHRKGRNNSLVAEPGDPGSPWAIGSQHGGHTEVEPALGSLEDFEHFRQAAERLGLEIALDFAIQCSPDHPWVAKHPEWFHHRPDGSIKYAENPPKKYQDIYPLNFDSEARESLWQELRGVLELWIERGVKIFRVDNPHTKPFAFWEWLIEDIQTSHPEVIFLSEAFTRPKPMKALAKLGFTQSYTYFTWRNHKAELTDYLSELTTPPESDYMRPNFFANTPDILPPILQQGGRPAFEQRLVLAATLSPSYGIYSGFELCENEAISGREEYLHSEKYEIKVRDWDAPGNIKQLVTRINRIRRENPALHELANLRFLHSDNEQLLCYAKLTADRSNVLLIAVNLDPWAAQHGHVWVPPDIVGPGAEHGYQVEDLLTGARYDWGEQNWVRLDPQVEPAHVLRVERRG